MLDLGTLGGPDAMALLVNERGHVVVQSYTSSALSPSCFFPLTTGLFLWQEGNMVDLGSMATATHGEVVPVKLGVWFLKELHEFPPRCPHGKQLACSAQFNRENAYMIAHWFSKRMRLNSCCNA